jgi:hypothetical protein
MGADMKCDRIAAMNRARDRKPSTGGKLYKQPTRTKEPTPAKGSWDRLKADTLARWQAWGPEDAIASYQFACYGDQWEGL